MWSRPFDPTDPRHRIALLGAGLVAIVLAVLAADVLIPAIVGWQIGGAA